MVGADSRNLEALLREADSVLSLEELRDIAAGVAAAPRAEDAEGWFVLAAPNPGSDLKRYLAGLLEEIRTESQTESQTGSQTGSKAGSKTESGPAPAGRLEKLRAELKTRGLDGFVVPLADEHQGESIPARAQRLAWLTGFKGSAGMAIVLADKAAIFVDGRYTLQVKAQVDTDRFRPLHITESPPTDWVAGTLPKGAKLGYDPWLHTPDSVTRFEAACARAGASFTPVETNPVDAVWDDQPPPPLSPAVPHDLRYAGKASSEKRQEIAAKLIKQRVDAAALSAPDSIAWLLNMRGGDIPNTPVSLGFALIGSDGTVDLFTDPRKLSPDLKAQFGNDVSVSPPDAFGPALDALGKKGGRVRLDPATAPAWILRRLDDAGATVVRAADPCALPKACKNWTELEGTRAAHRRDGASLSCFLAWLADAAPKGDVTEISAAARLHEFRAQNDLFRGVSFDTISGAGPNGAIVHYRVDETTDRALTPGDLYLVDSGAQYLDGTTDVTRTVFVGGEAVPNEARDRFTRVLKGHIALAMAVFPVKTTGSELDSLARAALWDAGLDYDHGTGHGVGSYLGVHEGPARISKVGSTVALKPGMILSNEPGYYKTDGYGIRIENLIAVCPARPIDGAEREMLEFETLTLAPIDRALIAPEIMTGAEIDWLDRYHDRVRKELTPLVDDATADWLIKATAPMGA